MKILCAIALLFAASLAGAVDKKGTIAELKARLETAKPKDQIELAIVIAQRQLEAADKAFSAGKNEEAQAEIADVAQYGVLAAQESGKIRKRMKKTEIDLRKMTDRLSNLAKSVDFDYQAPVQDALKKVEKARNDLLFRMFK